MLHLCRKDKEKVFGAIRSGKIDAVEISFPNLIDDIILTMKKRSLIDLLPKALPDKRRDNQHIPFGILLCLAVAAKLKRKTSLTDVPFAVTEAELLAELGWNLWDKERDINDGLFSESVMRKLLAKYSSEEWVSFYNHYTQDHLLKRSDIQPSIHILDCTKILVNLDNENYENSSVVKIKGKTMRGYKLGVLRGILGDSGIAEEIVFGTLKTHDMEQCRQMLLDTPCFHENDIRLVLPGVARRYTYTTANEHLCIHFRLELFPGAGVFPEDGSCIVVNSPELRREFEEIFRVSDPILRLAGCQEFALKICRMHWPRSYAPDLGARRFFEPVMRYIREQVSAETLIEDLAGMLGCSGDLFSRRFHAVFGESPKKYLQKELFARAALLLVDPEINVKEVAGALGFSSEFYFSKFFKRLSGMSPSEYRQRSHRVFCPENDMLS